MKLKEFFDKAENGTLTYDQLVSAMQENKSKFVDLSEGNYVDKQKYADDIAARDTRITTLDETIKTRDTDLTALRQKLADAGNDSAKLGELTNNFAELQKKYDKDTKAYEKQLKDQSYRYAVNEFANKQNFSSKAAKRDFVNTMLAKEFTIENDTIIGATDFVTAYAQENEDAFVKDTPKPAEKPQPHFAGPTSPTGTDSNEVNPFNFNFVGVRPHDDK